jgi:hypothetical protein
MFLEEIYQEYLLLLDTTGLPEPDTDVSPRETVVGTMTRPLMAVYKIRIDLITELKTLKDSAKKRIEAFEKTKFNSEYEFHQAKIAIERRLNKTQILSKKFSVVDDLFWVMVREEFPETQDKDSIGVRSGWKVVYE